MGNMSYCRFQNTLADLRDCYDALCEIDDVENDLSTDEAIAARRLLGLCREISSDFDSLLIVLESKKK